MIGCAFLSRPPYAPQLPDSLRHSSEGSRVPFQTSSCCTCAGEHGIVRPPCSCSNQPRKGFIHHRRLWSTGAGCNVHFVFVPFRRRFAVSSFSGFRRFDVATFRRFDVWFQFQARTTVCVFAAKRFDPPHTHRHHHTTTPLPATNHQCPSPARTPLLGACLFVYDCTFVYI